MSLRLALYRKITMSWNSSSAYPASSFPLCHVPSLLSCPPLMLWYVVQCHRWLLGESAQITNPAEKASIRIKLEVPPLPQWGTLHCGEEQ